MQLVKPMVENGAEQARKVAPGGLAGWLIAAFAGLAAGGWRSRTAAPTRQLKLVETLSLGGRRQLVLVSCGEERLLIGIGPDSVDSMIHLSDDAHTATSKSAKTMADPWA
ncbi:Flagellar biosynthesis protein, FliO [Granulicella rosea]|uniref:Flagellar biosynthesis protein, FliO n=1 Tax=Granulicella rosea TaxID=474952 RepID=A0A239EKA4_9BACT|nr:flagellar biosynthetic protein FliO [Granulicella rosea]SNS45085.1 Flagellar biosynthesis protein, FliO [Granulicella rosea]